MDRNFRDVENSGIEEGITGAEMVGRFFMEVPGRVILV